MSLSVKNLDRALKKGPIVLEGTFMLKMPKEHWTPPLPQRPDPIFGLLTMLKYFAILTLFLWLIGFLH